MEALIVIVGYHPKQGKESALRQLMHTHLPRLKSLGLVTDRASIIMESADGTLIEVFEWTSRAAMEKAHEHPEVLRMWGEYAEVCDYIPIGSIKEATDLFSAFRPFK